MFDQVMETIQAALAKVVEVFKSLVQAIRDFADRLEGYIPEIPVEEETTVK